MDAERENVNAENDTEALAGHLYLETGGDDFATVSLDEYEKFTESAERILLFLGTRGLSRPDPAE